MSYDTWEHVKWLRQEPLCLKIDWYKIVLYASVGCKSNIQFKDILSYLKKAYIFVIVSVVSVSVFYLQENCIVPNCYWADPGFLVLPNKSFLTYEMKISSPILRTTEYIKKNKKMFKRFWRNYCYKYCDNIIYGNFIRERLFITKKAGDVCGHYYDLLNLAIKRDTYPLPCSRQWEEVECRYIY